jgi:hypothetical protein
MAPSRSGRTPSGKGTRPRATKGAAERGPLKIVPIEPAGRPRPRSRPLSKRDREHLLAEFRTWSESAPQSRAEKVIEAKVRISRGHYDREDVRREVLRSVLRELLPRPSAGRRRGGTRRPSGAAKRPSARARAE